MTPKQKAADLFEKMSWMGENADESCFIQFATECALIAVDEILYVLNQMDDTLSYNSSIFYNEVKNEIEKL